MRTLAIRSMNWRLRAVTLAAAAGLLAQPGFAQEAAETAIEPAAHKAVERMVDTLGGAQRLSYEYESSYDAVQEDGELLEFGRRGAATIRRPDRVRGESWSREGRHLLWAWDGANVAVLDASQNVFATTPRTGDIDSLIDFLREEVGMRLPTANLFMSDLGSILVDSVVAARVIGEEQIDDVDVEHVALRLRTGIDVQLWIQTGKHAVPARLVMDFATADGRPQFRAAFRNWDLDPRTRDSLFELAAPRGARVVPFVLPPRRTETPPAQEDSR